MAHAPMHHPMVRRLTTSLTVAAATLGLAVPADAAQRYASPAASASESTCTSLTPCTADVAINGAQVGDEVIVAAGTYTVLNPITVTKAITVHGDLAGARPVLDGQLATATLTVSAPGATVSHLEIRSTGNQKPAISVQAGSTLDRVVAVSATGFGIDAVSDTTPTVIRNSVAVTHGTSSGTGAAGLRVSDGPNNGTAEIRNVTAWGDAASSVGFRCATTTATTTIVNTIARGTTFDIDAGPLSGKTPKCPATNSNARAAYSPSFSPATQADPLFASTAADDYRPLTGSSTIDAGTDAAQNGTLDLGGAARTQGAATDVGAFEFAGGSPASPPADGGAPDDGTPTGGTTDAGSGTPTTTPGPATDTAGPRGAAAEPLAAPPALPPAAPPALGTTMLLDTGKGDVRVRLPGTNRFIALSDASSLPFGTTIDATKGEVTLNTALPGGKQQTGTFSGGQFEVRQSKTAKGMTDIYLRGAFTTKCARRTVARAAAKAKAKKSKALRRLWGKDKNGRFRTHGKNSVATVRGTKWLTEDRCDGTYTKVTEGAVDVRSKRGGKTRRVKAGRSLLVRR